MRAKYKKFSFSYQIAGAKQGYKGSESNNMILALTPTTKISLKRLFDTVTEDLVNLQDDGFEAFDCFSGEVVKVKLPVTCIQGDLPAKGKYIAKQCCVSLSWADNIFFSPQEHFIVIVLYCCSMIC